MLINKVNSKLTTSPLAISSNKALQVQFQEGNHKCSKGDFPQYVEYELPQELKNSET